MIPRVLHQFWDTDSPPSSVKPLLHSWEKMNPDWDYRLWNDQLILELIKESFDEKAENAYKACRFPAMRADLGRYMALCKFGGLYADADLTCLAPIENFVSLDSSFVLFRGMNQVWRNDFIAGPSESPLFRSFIADSVENITLRRSPENLWLVTGPGMTTPIIDGAIANGLTPQKFEFLELRGKLFSFNNDLDYRVGELHWSTAQKSENIYVS